MDTKVIFLDIDGVLNNYNSDKKIRSKSRCGIYTGIDKDKVKRLSKIVAETGAMLILTSTWKMGWERYHQYDPVLEPHAKYLDNHLKKKGKLVITDKTRERNLIQRGLGIKAYLLAHPEITTWIVLDDEVFPDFESKRIIPHLIKINGSIGLTDYDADVAIKYLNSQIDEIPNQIPQQITTEKTEGPANKV